jgi:hypothetical protein
MHMTNSKLGKGTNQKVALAVHLEKDEVQLAFTLDAASKLLVLLVSFQCHLLQ